MKKKMLIVILVIMMVLTGCTNPLEKKNETTNDEPFIKGIETEEILVEEIVVEEVLHEDVEVVEEKVEEILK